MSKRTTIVLAAVALALAGYIVFHERFTLSSSELDSRRDRLIPRFVRDRVTRLEIEREAGRVVLERTRDEDDEELGEWRLVEPVAAETDFDAVDTALGALEWADARRTIASVSAEDRGRFGLEEPRLRALFTVAGERVPISFGAADPQEAGVYAQLDDPSRAHVVGKDVFEALDHDASFFRRKELLVEAGPRRAEALVLERGEQTLRLEKREGRWWITEPVSGWASAGAVGELLERLGELTAERFVADAPEDLSTWGLDPPAQVAHLSRPRADGEETVEATVRIGRPCDGHEGEVHARVDDGPVVCVSAAAVAPLGKPLEELREARVLGVRDDEVERVTIRSGNRRLELWREGGGWKLRSVEGPRETEGEADPAGVAELMGGLRGTLARRFEPADDATVRARGIGTPTATLTVQLAPGDDETERAEVVRLGLVQEAAAWARRGEEPAVLEVDPALAALLDPSPLRFRERRLLRDEAAQATRFLIRRETEREVLEKTERGWRVVEPIAVPADAGVVRSLTHGLAGLRAERFVAARASGEHGLAPPRITVEAHFEGALEGRPERRRHLLRIGAATDGGAFALLDDEPTVFVVDEALLEAMDGPALDRGLLATDRRHLERVTLERGGRRVVLTPGEAGWVTGAGEPADPARTEALIARLETLRAVEVVGYGGRMARPRLRVVLERAASAPEPREVTLRIGAEHPGEPEPRVEIRRADVDATLLIPAETAAILLDYEP